MADLQPQRIMRYPARELAWLWRELRIGVPVAFGVASFFAIMLREPFGRSLAYSLCITMTIQVLVEVGRYGLLRGLPDTSAGAAPGAPATPRRWPDWKWMSAWIVVSGVAGYFGGHAIGDVLTGGHGTLSELMGNPRGLLLSMTVVLVLSLGISYFHYVRGRIAAAEARAQAAMRSAAENQLRLLESQLEPHMLFNTLGNLRVMIGQDPQRAQVMLNQVISFLRATLQASRSGPHPLSCEFDRIADYLALMQVRMGARLQIELDLPAGLANLPVPPLLLQPLVENAIKHGLEPIVAGGWIKVTARREGGTLVLGVRDTGVGLSELPPGSDCFGTAQVRERLAQLYGKAASFQLLAAGDNDGGTLAVVRLPLS
ncbi:sensor histidine kinase [Cupriavidus basilensis]|uniref:sensor histidine kinase n=1 Tax=Cupriavidus basilensis TaxID=68895 RepID=UPI0002E6644B|nr:histidine kinase [Cupriavidus basilensis]